MAATNDKLRLDKYLWAIRIFKTRTQASDAIDSGKVKLNGQAVKASRVVGIGDKYDIKTSTRKWQIEVTGLLQTRAAFEIASKNYIDLTPEEDKELMHSVASSFYTGKRLSKTGRPTKKQRRDLDDLFSEDEAKD
jgi:ribosome-associated heat shock protein Hsp15